MTVPLHAIYLRSDQHTLETIHEALLELHLDEVWLRVVPQPFLWSGVPALQLELFHLREGLPILPEGLSPLLSIRERDALRLSVDATRTTVAYELCTNGQPRSCWAGSFTREETPAARDDADTAPTISWPEFQRGFTRCTGLDFETVIGAEAISAEASLRALPGTEILLRGRFLAPVEGMGRWPELFRFHDRNEGGGDHVALLGLDLQMAERLWRRTPAGQVYQYLRAAEPRRVAVLGPLAHALPEVLAAIEALPPEAPLVTAAARDLGLFEVLAMSTAKVFMVGDRLSYLDERFFPLLSLAAGPLSPAVLAESAAEIEDLGVLSAMVEALPYSVPEGEMIEAFADEEVSPLAPWAASDDTYEGSLFLLDPRRLRGLMEDFDIDRFKERIDAFQRAWFAATRPPGATFEEWRAARQEHDEAEMARFEDTFVELQHAVTLAELNELSLALLFYGE